MRSASHSIAVGPPSNAMTDRFLGVALVLFVLATGCATTETVQQDGFRLNKKYTEWSFDVVRNRATFELSCPRDQLALTVLNAASGLDAAVPTQIGVSACGHKAVYVHVNDDAGWVMNTVDGQPK